MCGPSESIWVFWDAKWNSFSSFYESIHSRLMRLHALPLEVSHIQEEHIRDTEVILEELRIIVDAWAGQV